MAERPEALPGPGRPEELELSAEEVERLQRAFRDKEFQALFAEFAAELADPAQQRLREEELKALERERGVELRFLHPAGGFVLLTSQAGSRRCYLNVCSDPGVAAPQARAQPDGHGFALPYALPRGREELGRRGKRRLIYDIVFHPAALRLAARSARFRRLLSDTAMDAVERHCAVRLDRGNAAVLRGTRYRGAPQAIAIRTPLPHSAAAPEPPGTRTPLPHSASSPSAEPPGTRTPLPHSASSPSAEPPGTRTPLPHSASSPSAEPPGTRTPLPHSASSPSAEPPGTRTPLPHSASSPSAEPPGTRTPLPHSASSPSTEPPGARTPLPHSSSSASPEPPAAAPEPPAIHTPPHRNTPSPTTEPPAVAPEPPGPTTPRWSILHRSYVDLQDYRCSRDSSPGAARRELEVTVELPLLRSAAAAELELRDRELRLDSARPAYRLRLRLPCAVDESRARAAFCTRRRRLRVTLPVLPGRDPRGDAETGEEWRGEPEPPVEPETRVEELDEPDPDPGTEEAGGVSRGGELGEPEAEKPPEPRREEWKGEPESQGDPEHGAERQEEPESRGEERGEPETGAERQGEPESRADPQPRVEGPEEPAASSRAVPPRPGTASPPSPPAMALPPGPRSPALCPPFQCRQDEASLTLLIHVPRIAPQSLSGDVGTNHYSLRFCSEAGAHALHLQFPPGSRLAPPERRVSVGTHNAAIELAKAPGSTGTWDRFCFGLDTSSPLQERLFISEENVDGFLGAVSCPSSCSQSALESQPLIEVLDVTEDRIQIRMKPQETARSEWDGKEELLSSSGGDRAEETKDSCPQTKAETHGPTAGPAEGERTTETNRTSMSLATAETIGKVGCSSQHCVQHEPSDTTSAIPGKSGRKEPGLESAITGDGAAVSAEPENQAGLLPKGPAKAGGQEVAAPAVSAQGNWDRAASPVLQEVNTEDGSVQIIRDHVTHCPLVFQNPLLYELD